MCCVFRGAVELLILAHDCFSLTCNMEGIVKVLQAARHLSHTHLAHGERYGLLVRKCPSLQCWVHLSHLYYLWPNILHVNYFQLLLKEMKEMLKWIFHLVSSVFLNTSKVGFLFIKQLFFISGPIIDRYWKIQWNDVHLWPFEPEPSFWDAAEKESGVGKDVFQTPPHLCVFMFHLWVSVWLNFLRYRTLD